MTEKFISSERDTPTFTAYLICIIPFFTDEQASKPGGGDFHSWRRICALGWYAFDNVILFSASQQQIQMKSVSEADNNLISAGNTQYSHDKKDTDPYNISPIEMRSLWMEIKW